MAEHQEEFTSENIEEQLESLFHANDVQAFSTSPEKNAKLLYYIQKMYQEQSAANTRSVEHTWQQLQLRKNQNYNQYTDGQEQLYPLNDLKMTNERIYTMQNPPKPRNNMRRTFEILAAVLVIGLLAGGLFTLLHFVQQPGTATHPTATSTPQTRATNTPQAVASPTPTVIGLGKDYAFVRNYQVWVALNGAAPVQATHLQNMDTAVNMSWGQTIWFDNDHYLAFSLATWGPSGGAGCQMNTSYGFSKAVFILNTQTMQLTQLSVSGDTAWQMSSLAPYGGLWGNFFREDATHLLTWHTTGGNAPAGLYRYAFTTSQLSMVIPATDLPETKSDQPYYSMQYNNGQLFYEANTPSDSNNSTSRFTIYSHSVTHPEQASVKVLEVGSEIFCAADGPPFPAGLGQFRQPGWDISPDGKQLVVQTFVSTTATTPSKIQVVSLQDGTSTALFAQVPSQELNQDVNLTWAPDNQTVQLVTSNHNTSQVALYTARITDAAVIQSYNIKVSEHGYWHSSSTAFVLSADPLSQTAVLSASPPSQTAVYLFTVGKPDGQVLLSNADNFSWGLNS